jgi:hypothetical protein
MAIRLVRCVESGLTGEWWRPRREVQPVKSTAVQPLADLWLPSGMDEQRLPKHAVDDEVQVLFEQ